MNDFSTLVTKNDTFHRNACLDLEEASPKKITSMAKRSGERFLDGWLHKITSGE